MPGTPTGTVTFLFTDVEGSTRLWESQREAMERAMSRHDELLRGVIEEHGGYIFTTAGDSFSAAFADASEAVRASLDAQRALAAEDWPVGDIRVRMGIHTGVAHERGGDYFGPVVNRAARIMSAGHGGQILLSQASTDLLAGWVPDGVVLHGRGSHQLKDLGMPERLFELVVDDHRGFPELRTLSAHQNNLPTELSSFVGRQVELDETITLLKDRRLVTLTGVGGSGKTRLALQAAAETFQSYPDGLWFIELANLADAQSLVRFVAEEMGITSAGGAGQAAPPARAPFEQVVEFLSGRKALLLLDNCEHVIAAAAEFVNAVLKACPELSVLATSREGLGVRGEHLMPVPSLGLPSLLDLQPGEGYSDAMELFAERASAVDPRFHLGEETAEGVAEICRRLDGMPLAIELAAARVRVLSPDQIASRLSDSFRLLTGGSRTALPRQQTLQATVDWSYKLLVPSEQALFNRIAVFRGGFSLEAAEAILPGDGVDDFEVLDLLSSLVEKSMLQGGLEAGRFTLLETLRQFALHKLTEGGDAEGWRLRHAEHFWRVADEAFDGTRGADQIDWLERIERDHENFDAAFTWALESGRVEDAARIADGLWWFWGLRAHGGRGLERLRALDPHLEGLPLELRVRILTGSCYLEMESGDWKRSLEAGDRALPLARALGDPKRLVKALIYWANSHAHLASEFDGAHAAYDEGLAIAERIGDGWGMGWLLLNKGWVRRFEGLPEEGLEHLSRSLEHFGRQGSPTGIAWATTGIGLTHRWLGNQEEAIRFHEKAAAQHRLIGNRGAVAFALFAAANSFEAMDDLDAAWRAVEEANIIQRQIIKVSLSGALSARIARRRGDMEGAVEALLSMKRDVDDSPYWDLLGAEVAFLLADLGCPEDAVAAFAAAEARREENRTELPAWEVARDEQVLDRWRKTVVGFDEVWAAGQERGFEAVESGLRKAEEMVRGLQRGTPSSSTVNP